MNLPHSLRNLSAGRLRPQALRFVLAGGLNTGLTLVLYWLLINIISPQVAYILSYCIGIIFSYTLSTRFVFRVTHSASRALRFPFVYLAGYAVGAIVLQFSIAYLPQGALVGPLLSAAFSIPITFLLSRLIMRPGST